VAARREPGDDRPRDPWTYRLVVIFLGLVALVAIIGSIILKFHNAEAALPDALVAFGSAALGALGGVLAPSPIQRG
jgi:hypothetical protein